MVRLCGCNIIFCLLVVNLIGAASVYLIAQVML